MITAVKIESYEELDKLIPMMEKFYHQAEMDKYYSLNGIIGHVMMKLLMPLFGIWKIVEDNKTIGYIIAEIGWNQLQLDCTITHAYSEKQDNEASHAIYNQIEEWARTMGCKTMSCYSTRERAMEKKYGFEPVKILMMKRL